MELFNDFTISQFYDFYLMIGLPKAILKSLIP